MDAVSIGVRLGSSAVAPLVKRLFRERPPGAGLVNEPVRLDALVSFGGEKRTLSDEDLVKLAGELVDRAIRARGPEGAALAEHRAAVGTALAIRLWALGQLDMDDVQAARLGADALAQALSSSEDALRYPLDADAEEFCQSLLRLACLHIIDFFTRRSTFVARTLVEQTRQNERIINVVDLLIERLPAQSSVHAEFEERYRRHVAGRHGRLTIFGLDLDEEWPLDDAYLHLETTRGDVVGSERTAPPQRAEEALRGMDRVLLRGGAGSGKTTLVQWLAVTTAEHRLPPSLYAWLGRVPFVLPMRTLTRAGCELPPPADFLAAVGCPHTPPFGWVERVLAERRGLLLVDGVDEIPEESRAGARSWLRELLREFPGNVVLVTARPTAVGGDWLAAESFGELSLSPMTRADVATFIERWHRAARAEQDDARELLDAVRGRQDLAQLATNPLMCAVMCALHRASHGYLPHGRAALYEAALRMLLERRDRQRKVSHGLRLDAPTQTLLLQKLAYWLIRNGHSAMDRADAEAVIEGVLPSMPQAAEQGDAKAVYRHLLERSGLLREPAEGLVDFVHRTFQDYLAAREVVEARDIPLLVRNAHRDQWEDVVRMAVAHGRPEERARILKALVKRGDEVKRHRIRLHLLAMACLEQATQLDPAVRTLVTSRTAELLPPRTEEEARALAGAGRVVLELLPGPEGLDEHESAAVVTTFYRVGGDAALSRMLRFCGHASDLVESTLVNAWSRLDRAAYAETVLPRLRADTVVIASSPEELALLAASGRRYRASGLGLREVLDSGGAENCESVRVTEPCEPEDLRRLSGLKEVSFESTAGIEDLSALSGLGLRFVRVSLTEGRPVLGLDAMRDVDEVLLNHDHGKPPFDLLPPDPPFTWFTSFTPLEDLTPLTGWSRLRTLVVAYRQPGPAAVDWQVVDATPVTDLYLSWQAARTLFVGGVTLRGIRKLVIHDTAQELDLARIAATVPHVSTLSLGPTETLDLSPLAALRELRDLYLLAPGSVTGAEKLTGVTVTTTPRSRYGTAP